MLIAVHRFASGAPQSDDITVFAIGCTSAIASAGWAIGLRVPDERRRLPEALDGLASTLRDAGVGGERIHDAQLVVEELLCNVMDHGGGADRVVLRVAVDDGRVVLDVRDDDEWGEGHVQGSRHLPYHDLGRDVPEDLRNGGEPLAVACSVGNRSSIAVSLLRRAGIEDVIHVVDGGVAELAHEGIELVQAD